MYTETSTGIFGAKAKLIFSPPSVAIGKWSCLKFYYHMYGATINRLNVFNGNCTVFTKLGRQGNMWMYAEVTVFVQNNVSSLKTRYTGLSLSCCDIRKKHVQFKENSLTLTSSLLLLYRSLLKVSGVTRILVTLLLMMYL